MLRARMAQGIFRCDAFIGIEPWDPGATFWWNLTAAKGECCIPMLGLIQCMYIYVSVLLRLHTGIQLLKSQDKIQQLEVFSNDFDGLAFFLV